MTYKLVHINLTYLEVQPILPHILALSIKEETLALRRKIISYCEGIALLNDSYREEWLQCPKYLSGIDFSMRWKDETKKQIYRITIAIEENERIENEDTIESYRVREIPTMRT